MSDIAKGLLQRKRQEEKIEEEAAVKAAVRKLPDAERRKREQKKRISRAKAPKTELGRLKSTINPEPVKQGWGREAYNEYQRKLMKERYEKAKAAKEKFKKEHGGNVVRKRAKSSG